MTIFILNYIVYFFKIAFLYSDIPSSTLHLYDLRKLLSCQPLNLFSIVDSSKLRIEFSLVVRMVIICIFLCNQLGAMHCQGIALLSRLTVSLQFALSCLYFTDVLWCLHTLISIHGAYADNPNQCSNVCPITR